MHPLSNNDNAHTGAPSGLYFPCAAYNMVAIACHLEDIFDMIDPKTNERVNKAKRLLTPHRVLLVIPDDGHREWGPLRSSHPTDRGKQR